MGGTDAGSGLSEYVRRRPAPALRPLIAGYIGYRQAGVEPGTHRGLPSPYLTVIFTLDAPLVVAAHPDPATAPGRYDALIGGLHTAPALITHDGFQSGIQLALSPLGARALLGVPAGELVNADLAAEDVLGPFGSQLRDRLRAAGGWSERFDILDTLLLSRVDDPVRPPDEVVRVWRRIVSTGGVVDVAGLAREVGWSSRHLSQRFRVEIGFAPKVMARVARFDQTRRLLRHRDGAGLTLAAAAARCGYFDQAHLARDFVAFAGCPPSRWLAEEFRNVQADDDGPVPDSGHDREHATTPAGMAHAARS